MTTQFTVTLTLADYVAANLLYQRRYWFWSGLAKTFAFGAGTYIVAWIVIATFAGVLTSETPLGLLTWSLGVGVALTILIPFVSLVAMRLTAKKRFNQLSVGLPISYEVDEESFRATNDEGISNLRWERLFDFVQNERLLLIRRAKALFFILPKAQLTESELAGVLVALRNGDVHEG